jgi:hypothetical protein
MMNVIMMEPLKEKALAPERKGVRTECKSLLDPKRQVISLCIIIDFHTLHPEMKFLKLNKMNSSLQTRGKAE